MAKVEQKQSKAAQPSICSLERSLNSDLNTHTQQQQQQQQQQKRLLALYAFRSCKIRTIVYSYSETTLRKKHRAYHSWQLVFRNPADFT